MPFVVETIDQIHEFMISLFKGLFPNADVSRLSFNWKFTRVIAAACADNHAHIDAVMGDLLPDTAEGDTLERWGNIVGVAKKSATGARKADALRVTGTPGSTVAAGNELTHGSGLRFQLSEAATVGAGGFVDVSLAAVDTGSATRLSAGEVLAFSATPAGIEESAELQLALDEDGDDVESDGAYRLRILNRFSAPPLGGSANDYEQWALSVTGIAAAYAYPNRAGYGTVDLTALHAGSGAARILLPGEVVAVQSAMNDLRPVGVLGFRVLTVVAQPENVELAVVSTGESAYDWDWSDQVPPVVSTWVGGTRTLTFTTARPSSMKAGDRIVLRDVAGLGTGQPYTIETLSGASAVVLESVPAPAPAAGDVVLAGGPLTDPVRAAAIAYFDALGTANPDATRYGPWNGTLRRGAIGTSATLVPGVLDVSVVSPVANVEADDPVFPADGTINLITPGRVLVRKSW